MTTLIDSAEDVDGPAESWRMNKLAADRRSDAARSTAPAELLLAPTLGLHLEGDAVEEVLLVRDQAAALAWAIERRIEGGDRRALDRFEAEQAARRRGASATVAPAPAMADLAYRLATEVPPHWYPLLPQQSGVRSIAFTLARVELGAQTPPGPLGRVLGGKIGTLEIAEEIERTGLRVEVTPQRARWTDGTVHDWIGRRVRPGRGEGSSGLRFDDVQTQAP